MNPFSLEFLGVECKTYLYGNDLVVCGVHMYFQIKFVTNLFCDCRRGNGHGGRRSRAFADFLIAHNQKNRRRYGKKGNQCNNNNNNSFHVFNHYE